MSTPDNQADPPPRSAPGITRRTFFRRLGAGLTIAIPSIYGLTHASPASADNDKPSAACPEAACTQTYSVYQGHTCGPRNSCPVGTSHHCIGVYYYYDVCSGSFCFSRTDDEGLCAGS
jgi:hypothetical protein